MKENFEWRPILNLMLEPEERGLWLDYNRLLNEFLPREARKVLAKFVTRLEAYPSEKVTAWVFELCSEICDTPIPRFSNRFSKISSSLFKEILLPELIRGYEAKEKPYARWLAQFRSGSQFFVIINESGIGEYSYYQLLREALEIDPSDTIALKLLIELLQHDFAFYVHEVPIGVLADSTFFNTELDEFEKLIAQQGTSEKYKEKLAYWRFHCNAWADYLNRRSEFKNYADYLQKLDADLIPPTPNSID